MKITLTEIQIYDKNKDGVKFVAKTGKNYKRVAIKCREKGDQWASNNIYDDKVSPCFVWKPNQEVDVLFTQNGQWLNWSFPSPANIKKQEEGDKMDRLLRGITECYKQNEKIIKILNNAFPEMGEPTMEDLEKI